MTDEPRRLPLMSVLSRLRDERYAIGLSQAKLARKAGCSATQIVGYERGQFCPRGSTLEWLSQALDLELTALPLDPARRADEFAAFLRAQGWRVEAPK